MAAHGITLAYLRMARSDSVLCSLAAISALCVCAPRPNKMDASSLAAAALAVAMEDSRSAAVRELMLDRERAAMVAEDRGSFLIERHFVDPRQVPRNVLPRFNWEDAFNNMNAAHDAIRASMAAIAEVRDQPAEVVRATQVRLEEELLAEEEEEDQVMEEEAEHGGNARALM